MPGQRGEDGQFVSNVVGSVNPVGMPVFAGPPGREGVPVHLGYHPTYRWCGAIPGLNNAPQQIYDTFGAVPFSAQGPGDVTMRSISILERPDWIGASYTLNGTGLAAGTIYQAPLTFSPRIGNPLQYMWPGTGQ